MKLSSKKIAASLLAILAVTSQLGASALYYGPAKVRTLLA